MNRVVAYCKKLKRFIDKPEVRQSTVSMQFNSRDCSVECLKDVKSN